MYFTKQDLNVFNHQAHQNVARQIEIENYEWKSASELADEIQKTNSKVAEPLRSLMAAYDSWLSIHAEIDQAETPTSEQNEKLLAAIDTRDSARQQLIGALAECQTG